jgi:hypothetical protein
VGCINPNGGCIGEHRSDEELVEQEFISKARKEYLHKQNTRTAIHLNMQWKQAYCLNVYEFLISQDHIIASS